MPPDLSGGSAQTDPRGDLLQESRCGVCEQFLTNPVSMNCGHSFCRQCISSYWDQSVPSGVFACPQCRKRSRTRPVLHPHKAMAESLKQDSHTPVDEVLYRVLQRHRTSMKNKYESLFEGIKSQENKTLLNRIYTQLYIIEGESEGVNEEHEVLQMEKTLRKQVLQDTPINCSDIFKPVQDPEGEMEEENIRVVMTKGIAGIGKTVSVQKFILDWAEGKANQDVDFLFVLPFRELNLIKDYCSVYKLMCDLHPEIKDLDPKIFDVYKVVLIFDGLDESRIPLNFSECEKVSDINMTSSISVLMSNLIKGELLPSALIWITSRPAAANQIPPQYINRVTEIQGFTDPQKEEYFRKRISDQDQAEKIISHIKTAKSLHIMCHMPVFCWISATVLQGIFERHINAEIPKTLTEMYIHFLLTQTNMKKQKFGNSEKRDIQTLLEMNRTEILKLAELAFKQLMKTNVLFYEEDLRECGIDLTEASVYSGICTEIFREESVLYQRKIYCFVHLSFQEFFAALYVFHCYVEKNMEVLQMFLDKMTRSSPGLTLDVFLKSAVAKALESLNGHLDLFLRFLHGVSLESNQKLLQGLLTPTQISPESVMETINNLKFEMEWNESPEGCINLIHCLIEMKDTSLHESIQDFLKGKKSSGKLTRAQCSVLAFQLQMSEEVLDELDPKKYTQSPHDYGRFLPAVNNCRRALLAHCSLTEETCKILSSVLQTTNCPLRELDLSHNNVCDSGVEHLSAGMRSSQCKLEILRLSGCLVTEKGCSSLASALSSNPSHLKELDLTYNHPGESGVKLLSALLEDPLYRLDTLRVDHAGKMRMKPGPRKYVCELTLDPNTAHKRLSLSEGNRKVTCVEEEQSYPDHPERFDVCYQVMCRESLCGLCYWEVQWSGDVEISVTYKGITRKGDSNDCVFGDNIKSWTLKCFNNSYTVIHNNQYTVLPAPPFRSNRVGVYLDWSAGTLSFYSVSSHTHTLTHIHTFHSTFTEPLYAGFGVGSNSSVCVCEVE